VSVNGVLKIHVASYMADVFEEQVMETTRQLLRPSPGLSTETPRTPPPRELPQNSQSLLNKRSADGFLSQRFNKRPAPGPRSPTPSSVSLPQPATTHAAVPAPISASISAARNPQVSKSQAQRKSKWTSTSRTGSDQEREFQTEDTGRPGPSSNGKQQSSLVHSTC
jgi:hypothetical protein